MGTSYSLVLRAKVKSQTRENPAATSRLAELNTFEN